MMMLSLVRQGEEEMASSRFDYLIFESKNIKR
jgi:hypothetical protein